MILNGKMKDALEEREKKKWVCARPENDIGVEHQNVERKNEC